MELSVVIYDSPGGGLLLDATPFARQLRFTTNRHGFADCSFIIPRNIYHSFYIYDRPGIPHVIVSWKGMPVWEGRLEDVAVSGDGARCGCFGYWRALVATKKYTAFWTSTRVDAWRPLTPTDYSAAQPEKFEFNLDSGINIGLKKNEVYTTASDAGIVGLAKPSRAITSFTNVKFNYVFTAASQFAARLYSSTQNYWAGTTASEWGIWGTGASQSGSALVTLAGSTPNSLFFQVAASTATASYTGESGDHFLNISGIRVFSASNGATACLYANEIINHVVSFAASANSTQIQDTYGLIQSPSVDLQDEVYQDANPADIIDQLALLGDGTERWEAGIWEDRVVHFRPRASEGRAWFVDVSSIDVERTLATLRNSVYAIYPDSAGRPLRTAATTDDFSIARYGVTQEDGLKVETTDTTIAGLQVDASISDQGQPVPRAALAFKEIYDANGGRWPAFIMRAGDTVTIRNLPPTLSTDIDKIRTFRVAETSYDAETDINTPTPESPLPTLDAQVAGTSVGGGSITSGANTGKTGAVNTKFGNINTDTISGGAVILDAGSTTLEEAEFLVLSTHTGLGAERVFVAGSGLSSSDAGANLTYTVALGSPCSIEAGGTNSTAGSGHTHAAASTLARSNESFVVLGTSASLTAERVLTSGSGLTYADGGANGLVTIGMGTPSSIESNSTNSTSGSSHTHAAASTLARSNESFVVLATSSSLTAERVLTTGSGLNYADAGAGGAVTISLGTPTSVTDTSTNSTTGSGHTHAFTSPSTLARAAESYLVLALSGSLSAERRLTTGSGLTFTDAGANSTLTLGVGSGSGITVTGSAVAIATPGLLSAINYNHSTGSTGASAVFTSGTAVSTADVSASIVVAIPSSASTGEPLLAIVATRGNSVTVVTPAGWENEINVPSSNVTLNVYSRITKENDAGDSHTFTFSASGVNAAAVIIKAAGATTGEFIDASASADNAAGTSVTIPSATTVTDYCAMLTITAWGSGAALTPDAETTELVEKVSTDGGNNVGIEAAYYAHNTSGSTGTKTHTLGSSADNAVAQIAFRPANSGGHQHIVSATHRPGGRALLESDDTGGLTLDHLFIGNSASVAGRQIYMRLNAEDVGMTLQSFSGSGKAWGMVSTTEGNLIIQDDSDSYPAIKLLSSGYIAIYPDIGKGVIIGPEGGGTTSNSNLETEETITLSSASTYGRAAAITFDPGYAGGASAVTKHIYMEFQDVSLANSASVTNAFVGYFNAAAGTHKAVDSGTTKTSPGTVSAWIKWEVNGTIYYSPIYTSKTS